MNSDNENLHIWNDELSELETFLIGKIISQWGALEHEVFKQTLMTFDTKNGEQEALPKAMNGLQFTGILDLWKERVADRKGEKSRAVLQHQYEEIIQLKDYRDALVHGMWEWSASDLKKITVTRIRKKEIISIQFNADALEDFSIRVGRINFQLRFPNGVEDIAQTMAEVGSYASRRWLSAMSGNPLDDDLLDTTQVKKK